MGEQADYILEQFDYPEDDEWNDVKYCKYCGKGDLYWSENFIYGDTTSGSKYTVTWRLFEVKSGKLHVCNQYGEKK